MSKTWYIAVLSVVVVLHFALAEQIPFNFGNHDQFSDGSYKLKWPVRKVAIIGAGPSGMIAYRELTREGFDVHVFERDSKPGGNWHYTEESPLPAPIPNADIAEGDYIPSFPPRGAPSPFTEKYTENATEFAERQREHRQPKPVWNSLKSNAPSPLQQIPELPWPAGTQWELTQGMLQNYMRAFASFHGINSNDDNPRVSYNTRVELVAKHLRDDGAENGWALTLRTLARTGANTSEVTWWTETFDAVVVGTGRFNAPFIPPIPGLSEWNSRFENHILHSRAYRRPEPFANETVLIIGAATSGAEIARDLITVAKSIYQSIRASSFHPDNASAPHMPIHLGRLPHNVTIIPEIARFYPISQGGNFSEGRIQLKNGTIITGIDRIIFASGYRYTFPFLPQYHNSSIGLDEYAPEGTVQPLVTDGTHIRSLHLDLFYIEEPTIGFLNMNLGMQSFVYAEYLALALAKVWGDKAKLPSYEEQWRLHRERVHTQGGYGRHFQYLGAKRTAEMIRFFVGWLNDAAVKYGGRQIDGPPRGTEDIARIWIISQFGYDKEYISKQILDGMTAEPFAPSPPASDTVLDLIFDDNW
ncbi:FAD/NAD(P)-binding domain-containing protein [Athelia psychrophila]|uniref:FAD/NAD(P)-binding domain-containing protein n=1 Tax=Athelia psychrophila TaxID=1759441 RepID=A0A166UR51_9AGAM|nr:FAD/NAD(P)-binding domain-containing protein [Fibularhizoctonia sp. CBS 109695]